MPLIIGLLVVFVIILYKRSTEIILVNPLHGARTAARVPNEDEQSAPDFARLLNTIQTAAEAAGANPATAQGRAAKKAIDKMMMEQ